jgi:hypothetical protein
MRQFVLVAAMFAAVTATAAIAATDARLPEGSGQAQVGAACVGCHDLGVVTGQHYSAEKWGQVVGVMIDRGANVSEADYDPVVVYLAKNFGPEKPKK